MMMLQERLALFGRVLDIETSTAIGDSNVSRSRGNRVTIQTNVILNPAIHVR